MTEEKSRGKKGWREERNSKKGRRKEKTRQ